MSSMASHHASSRQEINFLPRKVRPKNPFLSFSISVILSSAFVVILIVFLWDDNQRLIAINSDIATIEKNNLFQQSTISPTKNIKQYQSQLKALENKLLNRYQLWAKYQQITLTGKQGFSQHFYHIANLANANLSLYEIDIYNNGKNLSLKGYARKAEYIPAYINDLKNQKEFDQVTFGDLNIEKLADHDVMRFSLEKMDEEDNKKQKRAEPDINVSDLMNMPLANAIDFSQLLNGKLNDLAKNSTEGVLSSVSQLGADND